MTAQEKDTIYQAVCRDVALVRRKTPGGICYHWANIGLRHLRRAGLKPVLQAGSMQWPIADPDQDDGKSITHFSFMWEPTDTLSITAIALGLLPEIHIWIGLVETQEIVDFSTGDLKRIATHAGFDWRSRNNPPPYVWGSQPENVVYHPIREATIFTYSLILNDERYAKETVVC